MASPAQAIGRTRRLSPRPTVCITRIDTAAERPRGTMNRIELAASTTWIAASATAPRSPTSSLATATTVPSRNYCTAIGTPSRSCARISVHLWSRLPHHGRKDAASRMCGPRRSTAPNAVARKLTRPAPVSPRKGRPPWPWISAQLIGTFTAKASSIGTTATQARSTDSRRSLGTIDLIHGPPEPCLGSMG